MLRSAAAIIAGFLAAWACNYATLAIMGDAVVTTPGGLMLLAAGFVAMMLGGLIAARLAGRSPMLHAGLLAGFVAAMQILALRMSMANGEPLWLRLGFILVASGALVGAKLDARSETKT